MIDLVSKLTEEERIEARLRLGMISPDDGKYASASKKFKKYFGAEAEWRACAQVQYVLLQKRAALGQAKEWHVKELEAALDRIDPLNISLIEEQVTFHDQLALIEEFGNYISEETKALLHPGTTSYDILDTARSWLLRESWEKVMRPKVGEVIEKLCKHAENSIDTIQAGRTHLQRTSPITFGWFLAGYAARLGERTQRLDHHFGSLRGKISGIVGTGAGIEAVVGKGKSKQFERDVLAEFRLEPDHTATQVVQKERLCDVGNGIVTLMSVLGNFGNDMRTLYSSEINEVTSRKGAATLGGSSADASKNNPVNWENTAGKVAVVESGMRVLYAMLDTNLQRDLRNSVQARYQPNAMICQTYESFSRVSKELDQLSLNTDKIAENLQKVRDFPSEAMVSIMRGHGYSHPTHGVGHSAVKVFALSAKKEGIKVLDTALKDHHFSKFYHNHLDDTERRILNGELELYLGSAQDDARNNIAAARDILNKTPIYHKQ